MKTINLRGGSLRKVAKNRLGGNFGQVAQHAPGVEDLIPAPESGGAGGGLASGALGAIGGMLGGGSGGGLGSLGSLAGGFQKLGLSPAMIGRFLPIVLNYFQQKGSDQARGMLKHALT